MGAETPTERESGDERLPRQRLERSKESARTLVNALKRILKANSTPLALLATLDVALGLFVLNGINLNGGMIVIGDLPGFYYTGGASLPWSTRLALYPLSEQLIANFVGHALAHNIVYVLAVFSPSIGCYFLLQSIVPRRWLGVAVSFAFTTFVNPLTDSNFSGGGWFYFTWAALSFIALAMAWRAVCNPRSQTYAIASGFLVGLAAVQMDGYSGLQYFGTAADLCIIGTLYLYALCRWYPHLKAVAWSASILIGSFALIGLPVIARAYERSVSATSTPGQLAGIHTYVYGSIAFTFKQYGPYNALMNGPLVATYGAWTVPFSLAWSLLIALALIGAMYAIVSRRDPVRWLSLILLADYLFVCGFIAGIHSGALVPLFNRSGLLDFMDNPVAFLYIQFLLLPPMAFIGADTLSQRMEFIPTEIRLLTQSTLAAAEGRDRPASAAILRGKRLSEEYRELFAVCVVLVLAGVTCQQFSAHYANKFDSAPSTEHVSPFTPSDFSSIQSWYLAEAQGQPGQILVLPDSFPIYTKVWGFIPMDRLWVFPSLDNLLNNSYNVSQFVSIMNLGVAGDMNEFAQTLGVAGVHFVILCDMSNLTTLIPNYLVTGGVDVQTSAFWESLNQSTAFHRDSIANNITVFENEEFIPDAGKFQTAVSFGLASPSSGPLLTRNVLLDSSLDNRTQADSWIRYPGSAVHVVPGVGTTLYVNTTTSVPYAEFAGAINLTQAGASTPVNLTPNLTLAPSLVERSFSASADFSIPAGFALVMYLAYYNQSHLPPALFPVAGLRSLGTYYQVNRTASVNGVMIPSWVQGARLYFYAISDGGTGSGAITISNATFNLVVDAVNTSANATLQYLGLQELQPTNLIPSGSVQLYGPFDVTTPNPIPGSLVEVAIAPALELFNASSGAIQFGFRNLCQSGCPSGTLVTPFLSGYAPVPEAITTFVNGSRSSVVNVSAGNFTVAFRSADSASGTTWEADMNGTTTLFLGGAVVRGETGFATSTSIIVLPIGTISLSLGSLGGTYSRSYFVVTNDYAVDFESDSLYLPLPAAVFLCAVMVFWTSRKPPESSTAPARG